MKIMNVLRELFAAIGLAAMLVFIPFFIIGPRAATPGLSDLPDEKPISATLVVNCEKGDFRVVVMVVTFKNGKVIRFDVDSPHGLTTFPQLFAYGNLAEDAIQYQIGKCQKGVET